MDFALSNEQRDLADAERAWLDKHDPIGLRRRSVDEPAGALSADERRHIAEAGIGELLTEELGGTNVDLLVLVEAHGHAGSALPVAELALAGRLEEIVAARTEATHAGAGPDAGTADAADVVVPVLADGCLVSIDDADRLTIRGVSAPVTGLVGADRIVIVATIGDGGDLAAVVPARAVTVRPLQTLDILRSWAVAELDLTLGPGAWIRLASGEKDYVADQVAVFRAVDALGAADRLLALTVEYANQRKQFDSLIGSFQAIKHRCADMALTVAAARSSLWAAASALDENDADVRSRAVAGAAAYTGVGASRVAQDALQIHGGIGFTWEHDLHLLLRRIKVDELYGCSTRAHRRRLVFAGAGE
ncbi:MAG: acyl-CoA dehydrogenase family protein [Gordonia sp. (in: high G+C Gram-positive bacteria)]